MDVEGSTMMRRSYRRLFALGIFLLSLGLVPDAFCHIGNNSVFYEGEAGPYQVLVFIQPPQVVPGLAQINVQVHNGPATTVSALPVRWDAGRKGAPVPDLATESKNEPGTFTTQLWIMDFGAYSVFIDVEGAKGNGTAIVPFNSISTQRLPMPKWMGAAFLVAGVGLVLLLICIVGAAVRESVLPAGNQPDRKKRVWAWVVMGVASLLFCAVLWKGNSWWVSVDTDFQSTRLYKPLTIATRLEQKDQKQTLFLTIDEKNSSWRDHTPLVADHGKLMHLFLIREPEMNAFAHLHPVLNFDGTFESTLPDLPEGSYRVFADVVHESGLTQTLISTLKVPGGKAAGGESDPDDSRWTGKPSVENEVTLSEKLKVRSLGLLQTEVGREVVLRFDVLASDDRPAILEPYMGMWSHAVIAASDGSVFTHLHPAGTISLTAQELFARRERGESPSAKPIDVVCGRPERELRFPYSFPNPGDYTIWVQFRSGGGIHTAAFNIRVQPST
jgi:hypothetical protein